MPTFYSEQCCTYSITLSQLEIKELCKALSTPYCLSTCKGQILVVGGRLFFTSVQLSGAVLLEKDQINNTMLEEYLTTMLSSLLPLCHTHFFPLFGILVSCVHPPPPPPFSIEAPECTCIFHIHTDSCLEQESLGITSIPSL